MSDEPIQFPSAPGTPLVGQAITFEYGPATLRTRSRVLLIRSNHLSVRSEARGAELFVSIGYTNSAARFPSGLPYFERFQHLVEAE